MDKHNHLFPEHDVRQQQRRVLAARIQHYWEQDFVRSIGLKFPLRLNVKRQLKKVHAVLELLLLMVTANSILG